MSFTATTLITAVASAVGLPTSDIAALTSRLLSDVNWGVKEWSRAAGVRYYERDLSYRPDSIASYATDTATIDLTDPYKLTFAGTVPVDAKFLLGAVVEKTSEDNNAVQAVSTLTARMKRNVLFATGTVTVKQRSILHDSVSQKFYSPFRTGAYILINDTYRQPVKFLEEGDFWRIPDIFEPTDTYPSYFTCLKCSETGIPQRLVMNTVWPLTPNFTFCARLKTIPTDVTAGGDSVDAPDGVYQALLNYVVASYRYRKGYVGGEVDFYEAKRALRAEGSY